MILEEKYKRKSNYNQTVINLTSNQTTNSNYTLFDMMAEFSLDISEETTIDIDLDVKKEVKDENDRLL
jgi:hypothetical protein